MGLSPNQRSPRHAVIKVGSTSRTLDTKSDVFSDKHNLKLASTLSRISNFQQQLTLLLPSVDRMRDPNSRLSIPRHLHSTLVIHLMALPHVARKLVPTRKASSVEPAVVERAEEGWSPVLLGMAVKISLSSEGCLADGADVVRGRFVGCRGSLGSLGRI
jgi:hypothetical protein